MVLFRTVELIKLPFKIFDTIFFHIVNYERFKYLLLFLII
jgi:hypothetical protein